MNKVMIIGNFAKDITLRQANGISIANGVLCVNRAYKGKDSCDFLNIVFFNGIADNLAKYNGKKGDKVAIIGRIENRSYTNQQGEKKYITEIIAENVEFLKSANRTNTQPTLDMSKGLTDELFTEIFGEENPFEEI